MSDPYEGGPSTPPGLGTSVRPTTATIQQQIDDTVGIMKENVTKVAERGERLESLQTKTDNLAVSAQGFNRGANQVRKNMWWKKWKWYIITAILLGCITAITVPCVLAGTRQV